MSEETQLNEPQFFRASDSRPAAVDPNTFAAEVQERRLVRITCRT